MYKANPRYRRGMPSAFDIVEGELSNSWRANRYKLYSSTGSPVINYRLMVRSFDRNQREMIFYRWTSTMWTGGVEHKAIKPIRSHIMHVGKRTFTQEAYEPEDLFDTLMYHDMALDSDALAKVYAQVLLLDDSYEEKEKG